MTFQLGKTGAAHGCSEERDLAPAEKFSRGKNATRFAVRKRGLNYHVSGGIRPVAIRPPRPYPTAASPCIMDPVLQGADPVDADPDEIAWLEIARQVESDPDIGGRPGCDDVARNQRH
jgi:hypothetical protein